MSVINEIRMQASVQQRSLSQEQYNNLSDAARRTYTEQLLIFRLSQIVNRPPEKVKLIRWDGRYALLSVDDMHCWGELRGREDAHFQYHPECYRTAWGRSLRNLHTQPLSVAFTDSEGLQRVLLNEERAAKRIAATKSGVIVSNLPLAALIWGLPLLLSWAVFYGSGEYSLLSATVIAILVSLVILLALWATLEDLEVNTPKLTQRMMRRLSIASVYQMQSPFLTVEKSSCPAAIANVANP